MMTKKNNLFYWRKILLVCILCLGWSFPFTSQNFFSQAEVFAQARILQPRYTGKDIQRKKIAIRLQYFLGGFEQPVAMFFVPGFPQQLVVLEKKGKLKWFNLHSKETRIVRKLSVLTRSEQGLLGLAFHPDFSRNGKLYLHYSTQSRGKAVGRISEWQWTRNAQNSSPAINRERILLEVEQPFANHDAGTIAFGPDGKLYIAWGDGGYRDDPYKHGQNPNTFLGSLIRIDVDRRSSQKPYAIPPDNPFRNHKGYLPEIWAFGLRNPWKFSFTVDGRLIMADVGQDEWEEINLIEKGKNYGWNIREATHCFESSSCESMALTDPFYEYGRKDGSSITGGFVYQGKMKSLRKKYIFGDFVSGRIWAIKLPSNSSQKIREATSLGQFSLGISSFGQDSQGEIYVLDFYGGTIYKIIPAFE